MYVTKCVAYGKILGEWPKNNKYGMKLDGWPKNSTQTIRMTNII